MQNKLNVIFAGTPDFSASILDSLYLNNNINISAVYTQPDRPSGRGKKITASPVKSLVLEKNQLLSQSIPVEQPDSFRKSNQNHEQYIEKLKSYKPDLIIVVAYGLILPKSVIEIPTFGCINIHTSLLPRWRGAAPIQRAILAGDSETGVTIQQIDTGLDTGDIIAIDKCNITQSDTTLSLTDKLLNLSKPLLNKVIDSYIANDTVFIKQDDSKANYAEKIDKSESLIDFHNDADTISRQIRAFIPWPIAKIALDENTFIKVFSAEVITDSQAKVNDKVIPGTIIESSKQGILIQCGKNSLNITQLQFSGGKIISAQDALNGKYKEIFMKGNKL